MVQGCETKEPKIVKVHTYLYDGDSARLSDCRLMMFLLILLFGLQMCLGTIQKLITHRAVDQKGARYITDTLWMLMESGTEHVKVLQSVTLLLTTDCVVRSETLARVLDVYYLINITIFNFYYYVLTLVRYIIICLVKL